MTTAERTLAPELEGLDSFIQERMEEWKVPGLAIAVVRDGEILLCQGFGKRDVEQDLPVTSRTLFAIGSSSKAFTTMALGILADEGKLDWDRPVREYLPWFAMYDTFASERITPRDLVCHRSGLPRHDAVWYNARGSRRDVIERIRYLEPTTDFRTTYQYQNLMFLTAGYLAGELGGSDWETFVQERILDPLGMTSTNFSVETSQQSGDFALPYAEKDNQVQAIPFRNIDLVGPAGSINSNVEDMARWVMLHLGKGTIEGEVIVSEAQIAQMHKSNMTMAAPYLPIEENALGSYGLGWFIESYNGDTVIHHGGAIDGFLGQVAFVPKHNIGVSIQTNLNGNPFPMILAYQVFDRLRGRTPSPVNEQVRKVTDEAKEAAKKGKEQNQTDRVPNTSPSHDLDAYTGEYEHPGYGTITIGRNADGLTYTYNNETFPLSHYHYDIYEFTMRVFELRVPVSFITGMKGDIEKLLTPIEQALPPREFVRAPDKSLRERSFLERFVGEYELMGRVMTVTLEGEHALIVSLPGAPVYELEPFKGTEFRIKGLAGYSITFQTDESGAVTGAVVSQPVGVFTATKKA
jgi:CubicO group peptidase (beta-lactamase class C family)